MAQNALYTAHYSEGPKLASGNLTSLPDFSVSFWYKVTEVSDSNPLMHIEDATYYMHLIFNGPTTSLFAEDGAFTSVNIAGDWTGSSTWYWCALVCASGSPYWSLYVMPEGGAVSVGTNTSTALNTITTPGVLKFFDTGGAAIAAAKFWSAALSDAEIRAERLYNTPTRTANLWAWWDTTGADVAACCVDTSGNGHTLTAANSSVVTGPTLDYGGTVARNPVAMGFVVE